MGGRKHPPGEALGGGAGRPCNILGGSSLSDHPPVVLAFPHRLPVTLPIVANRHP